MISPTSASFAVRPTKPRDYPQGFRAIDSEDLNADPSSDSNLERGSLINYTVEPYSRSPPEPPQLEGLHLQDRSITPGKSRKRQLPPQEAFRPRSQSKVLGSNCDDGHRGLSAGDSPVASGSMLDVSSKEEIPVNTLTLQPETRQISEEQLINEVRTIYAGLVLVEKKCVEIDRQQVNNTASLSNEQWQALIALHRTLLHEHHDFFLASQHPSASPALQKLASRYAMPARMWRHGIHSFLELLRHRLPEALDHMLAFIYTAYSMMALLLESVPSFEDTWIECLGDLARYRMAVEESDLHDREIWAGVARYWYNKAADKSPLVGRIQHHLAVLARPNILQQLFFYSKSLICVQPFPNTRESILLLFNPLLESGEPTHHSPVMLSFVKAHGILFGKKSILSFLEYGLEFISYLGTQIGRVGSKWREQGVYIASANFASFLEYGADSIFMKLFLKAIESPTIRNAKQYYQSAPISKLCIHPVSKDLGMFKSPIEVISYASCFTFHVFAFVLKHIGDKNVLPHVHVSLAFLWALALVPEAMSYIQSEIPWRGLVTFLNTLNLQGLNESRLKSGSFPIPEIGMRRHLPEDFSMRGLIWSQLYYPSSFFDCSSLEDDEERSLELPSVTAPRAERCLWLGHRLASLDVWIAFDEQQKQFGLTEFALELETHAQGARLLNEAAQFFDKRGRAALEREQDDMKMTNLTPANVRDGAITAGGITDCNQSFNTARACKLTEIDPWSAYNEHWFRVRGQMRARNFGLLRLSWDLDLACRLGYSEERRRKRIIDQEEVEEGEERRRGEELRVCDSSTGERKNQFEGKPARRRFTE